MKLHYTVYMALIVICACVGSAVQSRGGRGRGGYQRGHRASSRGHHRGRYGRHYNRGYRDRYGWGRGFGGLGLGYGLGSYYSYPYYSGYDDGCWVWNGYRWVYQCGNYRY